MQATNVLLKTKIKDPINKKTTFPIIEKKIVKIIVWLILINYKNINISFKIKPKYPLYEKKNVSYNEKV